MIRLKRIYDAPSQGDGFRVLVERLWPRGLTKERAAVDLWARDISPGTALRKWFAHDRVKWEEFRRRYWKELEEKGEKISQLKARIGKGRVTFVFAARDENYNSAVILKEFLEKETLG